MVSQKLISFKIDVSLLARLDSCLIHLRSYNRNKLLNRSVEFVVSAFEAQLDYALRNHKSPGSIPFLS